MIGLPAEAVAAGASFPISGGGAIAPASDSTGGPITSRRSAPPAGLRRPASPPPTSAGWNGGAPYWRAGGYWRNASGGVTFPLNSGGWSSGTGQRYVALAGVSFEAGLPQALMPYGSIAVDPRVIPLGCRVYIPAYRNDGHGGWFIAQDTGGAIVGHRIDLYRTPPAGPNVGGQYLTSQRVFVVRPGS